MNTCLGCLQAVKHILNDFKKIKTSLNYPTFKFEIKAYMPQASMKNKTD